MFVLLLFSSFHVYAVHMCTCVYMCVHAYFCMYGDTHKWTYVCVPCMGGPKVDFWSFPWVLLLYSFRQGLSDSELHRWPVLLGSLLLGSCLCFWGWITGQIPCPCNTCWAFGNLNSGSHACIASALPRQQVKSVKANLSIKSSSFLCWWSAEHDLWPR